MSTNYQYLNAVAKFCNVTYQLASYMWLSDLCVNCGKAIIHMHACTVVAKASNIVSCDQIPFRTGVLYCRVAIAIRKCHIG